MLWQIFLFLANHLTMAPYIICFSVHFLFLPFPLLTSSYLMFSISFCSSLMIAISYSASVRYQYLFILRHFDEVAEMHTQKRRKYSKGKHFDFCLFVGFFLKLHLKDCCHLANSAFVNTSHLSKNNLCFMLMLPF